MTRTRDAADVAEPPMIVFTTRPATDTAQRLFGASLVEEDAPGAFPLLQRLMKAGASELTTIRSDAPPRAGSPDTLSASLPDRVVDDSGLFVLRLASDALVDAALAALAADPRILTANRPSMFAPIGVDVQRGPAAQAPDDDRTSPRRTAGFDRISGLTRSRQAPIAMIDHGRPNRHAFGGRLGYRGDGDDRFLLIAHGMQVAGVLAGEQFLGVPRGCCEAHVAYHNTLAVHPVSGAAAYSPVAFHTALRDFLDGPSRVLNVSLAAPCLDATVVAELATAERRGKLVVAAMPTLVDAGSFPADQPTVIAAGNGNAYRPHPACCAWISVQAHDLVVLDPLDDYALGSGTSFAAAAVSAAAWLAFGECPMLTPAEVRTMLKDTAVNRLPRRDAAVGWGSLDAFSLVAEARRRCRCRNWRPG